MGKQVNVGASAPDFTLASTTGQPVSLLQQRGKWVFLVFNRGFA